MKLATSLAALMLLLVLGGCLSPVGINPISPAQLTKGRSTLYEFSFLLDRNVTLSATVDIGFPG